MAKFSYERARFIYNNTTFYFVSKANTCAPVAILIKMLKPVYDPAYTYNGHVAAITHRAGRARARSITAFRSDVRLADMLRLVNFGQSNQPASEEFRVHWRVLNMNA